MPFGFSRPHTAPVLCHCLHLCVFLFSPPAFSPSLSLSASLVSLHFSVSLFSIPSFPFPNQRRVKTMRQTSALRGLGWRTWHRLCRGVCSSSESLCHVEEEGSWSIFRQDVDPTAPSATGSFFEFALNEHHGSLPSKFYNLELVLNICEELS